MPVALVGPSVDVQWILLGVQYCMWIHREVAWLVHGLTLVKVSLAEFPLYSTVYIAVCRHTVRSALKGI